MSDRLDGNPFQLGRWRVEPRELRLSAPGETRTLEPRVMAVLLALARTPGHVVTKEQLLADAWQGTPVTDNAITWAISRLRKNLEPDGGLIRTVTGQGYRLEADVSPLGAVASVRRRWPTIAASGGLAIVGIAIVLLLPEGEPNPLPVPRAEPRRITTLPGRETEPAISDDGRWLAFAYRATPADSWELRIVATAEERLFTVTGPGGEMTGELRSSGRGAVPRRISQRQSNNRAPSWSPSGRQLAYFATTPRVCSLRRLQFDEDFSVLNDSLVTGCQVGTSGRVAWLGENEMLAAIAPPGQDQHALHRIDLTTGEETAISDPGDTIPGDRVFGLSPTRDQVVLIRHHPGPESELFIGPVDGQAWKWLGSTPYWFHAVTVNGEGLIRFNATDREVVTYDPHREAITPLLRHNDRVWGLIAGLAPGEFIFESFPPVRARIVARGPAGAERVMVNSAGMERSPALAADGTLAWVSDRTGSQQLWLREKGGEDRQFSDARGGQQFKQLRWSQDSNRLLAIADGVIGSVGRDEADFAVHSEPGDVVRDPSWSPDGSEVRFSLRSETGWDLVAVDVREPPGSRRVVLKDTFAARALAQGRIAHFRESERGLWVAELDGTRRRVADVAQPDHWWVDEASAWVVADGELIRVHLADGAMQKILDLGPLDGSDLFWDEASETAFITRYDNPESDIVTAIVRD